MRSFTIRKKILLLAVGMISVICIGMGLTGVMTATSALQKNIESTLPLIASENGRYISAKISIYKNAMETIANRGVIRGMKWEREQAPALRQETARQGFLGMGIVMPDGTALYPNGKRARLGDRDYVRKAFKGETVASDIIVSRVTGKPVMMIATPIRDRAGSVLAVLIARLDGLFLSRITDTIRYGNKGYSYVINKKGALIAHKNRKYVTTARNFLVEGKTDKKIAALSEMMSRMVNGESGFSRYWFLGGMRLFGYAPVPGTGWSIAVGAETDEVFSGILDMRNTFLLLGAVFLLLGILGAYLMAGSISRPLVRAVDRIKDIAEGEGDLTKRLAVNSTDETGQLAKWVNRFIENLQNDIRILSGSTDGVLNSAKELSMSSQSLSAGTEQISSQAQTIAAATTQMNQNQQVLSSSIEEMSISVAEVARKAAEAARSTTDANNAADVTAGIAETLASSAAEIGKVSELISGIASQVNLLALNAAIEAASAGEAGRGFAVVAAEVKELAEQTGASSDDIRDKVNTMQNATNEAVSSISEIKNMISRINEISTAIASSVEEQSITAKEISGNLSQTATASSEVARNVGGVAEAATGGAKSASDVANNSQQLEKLAAGLKSVTEKFKT